MTIQIGSHAFDDVFYDSAADVLYLSKGEPQAAASSRETPEGHVVRLDESEEVVGITLIGPRALLARDRRIVVTLPDPVEPDPDQLEAAISGAP